ncbi:hypothetical protein LP419_25090 [Massilia sp. H-1]|nr:hypothetical protein LP419_25090 [Massilia sp. H-1]
MSRRRRQAQLTPPPAPAASEIKQQSDPKPAPVPQVEIKAPAPSTAPGAPKGTLVIIGGGLRGENEPVWERIVELARGKGARIAVFGTASASPERAARLDAERLNFYGADAFVVPVAVRLKGTDYRAAANDPVLAAQVSSAAGAYFVGGDQARITEALRKPDGSSSLMLDALWDMYRRGSVIVYTQQPSGHHEQDHVL